MHSNTLRWCILAVLFAGSLFGRGSFLTAESDVWDLKREYRQHIAYVAGDRAKVELKSADRPNREFFLRLMCKRALSIPYSEDLKNEIGNMLNIEIGPSLLYIEGSVESFKYTIDGASAECSGQFREKDRRTDRFQLILRIMWTDRNELRGDAVSQLLDELLANESTEEDALSYYAYHATIGEFLLLAEDIDWDVVTLDLARVRVADRLMHEGYHALAKRIIKTCGSSSLCAAASARLSEERSAQKSSP